LHVKLSERAGNWALLGTRLEPKLEVSTFTSYPQNPQIKQN